ncbi:hypothetical protein CHU95_16380 [Niveispirillum lacus]|uniref:EF-hand domain-containing protein n=2 Tax=Niveispirillum lacus TaxID=1981099 RepID=A0A255YT68_9PROT|nr:hypothetical protein CHU95_16380 [Niveispirillum lacus]
MALALASCGGGRDTFRPGIRYSPVSPVGEPLAAPTRDAEAYRAAMRDWFTRADTDRNGTLSLLELTAEAGRVFPLYDLNRDGYVTSYELTQYRVNLPTHSAPADTGRRLRPGRIDMTPDEAATARVDGRGRADYRMGIDPVMSADSNADFRVTPEELRAEATRRHAIMDQNGDGTVSRPEFMEQAEGPMRAWAVED